MIVQKYKYRVERNDSFAVALHSSSAPWNISRDVRYSLRETDSTVVVARATRRTLRWRLLLATCDARRAVARSLARLGLELGARGGVGRWRTHTPGVASHTSRMPDSAAIRYTRYTHRARDRGARWTRRKFSRLTPVLCGSCGCCSRWRLTRDATAPTEHARYTCRYTRSECIFFFFKGRSNRKLSLLYAILEYVDATKER